VDKETPTPGVLPGAIHCRDTEVLILDESGHPVGVDQIGEMPSEAGTNAVGYWQRPAFLPGLVPARPGRRRRRIYRTGTWVAGVKTAACSTIGRKDFQVKIRGYPGEVAEVRNGPARMTG